MQWPLRQWRGSLERRRDFTDARSRLLASGHLTSDERALLAEISLNVDPHDAMYVAGRAEHYLSVGLSATRCIREVFGGSERLARVSTLLDLPSGHGRVLRWLRVMFRHADISCAEIDAGALTFCARTFRARAVRSSDDINAIAIPGRFDLIWCGSLLTHLNADSTSAFLRLFRGLLADAGVCVFTMHGRRSSEWIKSRTVSYGLREEAQDRLLLEFETRGYGHVRYAARSEYGVSLASEPWVDAAARRAGPWTRVLFREHGWDNHQDVYAFIRD